jgi:anti-sigma B factor antagonist
MSHEFGLDLSCEDGAVIMYLRGEVDLACRGMLADTAYRLLADNAFVMADLAAVTFLDSSGVSALVRAKREASRLGRDFRVRSATGPVADVLEVTGLGRWLCGPTSDPAPASDPAPV